MCEIANSSGCVCVCVHIIYSGLYTTTEVRIKGLHAAQQYRWIRVLLSSKTARQHFERKEPEGEPCPLLLHIFAFGTETAWTHCIKVLGARLGFDVPLSKWLAIGWYIKRREIKVKNKINKNVMNIREGEGGVAGKKREEKKRFDYFCFALQTAGDYICHGGPMLHGWHRTGWPPSAFTIIHHTSPSLRSVSLRPWYPPYTWFPFFLFFFFLIPSVHIDAPELWMIFRSPVLSFFFSFCVYQI